VQEEGGQAGPVKTRCLRPTKRPAAMPTEKKGRAVEKAEIKAAPAEAKKAKVGELRSQSSADSETTMTIILMDT